MSGSMPRTRIVPLVGMSRVASIFIVVVFPAPFGPRRPKISPGSTTRSIPSTARKRSRLSCSRRSRCQIVRLPRSKTFTRSFVSTAGAAVTLPAQSRGFAARHAQAGGFAPRRQGQGPLSAKRGARRSFHKDFYPVLVVGDVNDLAREVDAPEELVEIDAEFPKMSAHETAGCEVQLSDPRDRERDRDIDFLCAVLRDPDSQDPSTRAGRARRVGCSRRTGRSRRESRPGWARPTLLDVAERAQQPV